MKTVDAVIDSNNNNMARNNSYTKQGGDHANVPPHIVEAAGLRQKEIVAWTYLDPANSGKICPAVCRTGTWLFLRRPCYLPIILPCYVKHCIVAETKARSTHWILTKQDLKIVILDYSVGCCTSGVELKTIPLVSISNAASYVRCRGVPSTIVTVVGPDLKSRLTGAAGAYGLMDHEWFIQEILNARDAAKGGVAVAEAVAEAVACNEVSGVCSQSMERDDNPTSAQQRLRQIIELRDTGLLTCEEYDKKRQEIISSL